MAEINQQDAGSFLRLRSQGRGSGEREDLGSVLDTHKFAMLVRYLHGYMYLESRRYLAHINICGTC